MIIPLKFIQTETGDGLLTNMFIQTCTANKLTFIMVHLEGLLPLFFLLFPSFLSPSFLSYSSLSYSSLINNVYTLILQENKKRKKDVGMACQKVCKQVGMMHDNKGQRIGKAPFPHLFHTTVIDP